MDYIQRVLGIKVSYEQWDCEADMPYFITDQYEIQKAFLGAVCVLFLKPKSGMGSLNVVKKHIARIQKTTKIPIVLELDTITKYRRDALISAKIPFVVPERQLYLPFLGTVLTERCDAEPEKTTYLLPVTQVLFFYYLYQKLDSISCNTAAKALGYSAMSISRASKQLLQTELFAEKKEGVQKVLLPLFDRKKMLEEMKPYLQNPVKRKIYIPKDALPPHSKQAGLSAMAHYTMLNAPTLACCAIGTAGELKGTAVLVDAEAQVEVEIWKYDPAILARGDVVDPLSLIFSLPEDQDERTEEAVEEILKAVWEE